MFEVSFQTATSTSRRIWADLPQGGIISPALFSLYVNDIPSPSHHVELALYADTAVIAKVPSASAARQIPGDISQ